MGEDFRWADESKVERIKKQDGILSGNFIMKVESIVEGAIRENGGLGKIRRKMRDEHRHSQPPGQ
jgi:hypothetical protein